MDEETQTSEEIKTTEAPQATAVEEIPAPRVEVTVTRFDADGNEETDDPVELAPDDAAWVLSHLPAKGWADEVYGNQTNPEHAAPTEEEVQADSEEYAARSGAETTSDGETDDEAAGESEESAPVEQAAGE